MQPTRDLSRLIRQLRVPASPALDRRVHAAIDAAAAQQAVKPPTAELSLGQILTLLMKKKSIRYTLATTLGLVLLAMLALNHSTASAWAIDQAIETLQKYKAVRLTGFATTGGPPAPVELWARADATSTRSDACLLKSESYTAWVRANKTYIFEHARNTVYVDPAVTIGLNPWFGPRFLRALSKLPDYTALEGDDPATGQKQILVTASFESSGGPQSFLIEFDARTRLPVVLKHWTNLKRQGAPDFSFEKIVYFEELPDGAFRFEPPAGVQFTDRPLTIPEGNLAKLRDPKSGIPADGLTREEACRTLLEAFWTALIGNDLTRVRQLCPVVSSWPDGLLRDLGAQDDVLELLQIGGIEKEGQSRLGPLALVSSRVRCRDGKLREIKVIVQFRETDEGTSCVIHGNYGYSVEVEEGIRK